MDVLYFRTLFAYNDWANGRLLDQAEKANEADYYADLPGLSFGNLHDTLAHVLLSEIAWQVRWTSRPPYQGLPNSRQTRAITKTELKTLAELRERWRAVETERRELLARLTDADVDAPYAYQLMDGSDYSQPLGHQLAHVVNHGTQFRSEAAVRLTQLGLSPGEIDLIAYLRSQA